MYLFYKHNKEEQRTNYPFFQCSYTLKKGPDGRCLGTTALGELRDPTFLKSKYLFFNSVSFCTHNPQNTMSQPSQWLYDT